MGLKLGHLPADGLAGVDPSVLHLGVADVEVRYDVTMHRNVLANHEPETSDKD
jgi:hypothetical protein